MAYSKLRRKSLSILLLTNHKHGDQSSNKNEHRLLTFRGATRSVEVEEEGDADTEVDNTIVPVLDGDPGTTIVAVEGDLGITFHRCYQIYPF
jgi:hypothetical protein